METLLRASLVSQAAKIDGWFAEPELDLLIRCLELVAGRHFGPFPLNVVEIGSYKGRSTSALALALSTLSLDGMVYAIDPHQGLRSGRNDRIYQEAETYMDLVNNLRHLSVERFVRCIRTESTKATIEVPISLLLIDGLHLSKNVRADFTHFEKYLISRAIVTFHDCNEDFPGVVSFVNSLLSSEPASYLEIGQVQSLIALEKVA
jgi:hypothetical protein